MLARFTTVALLLTAATGFAEDDKAKAAAYAKAIAGAQADLDAGKTAEAKQKLEATEKALRSFEFDYLMARTASDKGADIIKKIARPKEESYYGVLHPSDKTMVYICRDGKLRIHDLAKPEGEAKVVEHTGGAIWCGTFSRDGKSFAAGYENGDVVVFDVKTWKPRHTVAMGAKVRELVLAPDGSAMVAEGKTELELWSLGEKPAKIAGVGERLNFGEGVAFSPKGDQIATGGMFDITLFDAKTGAKSKAMRHASYTMGLEFSPDGKSIASAPRGNVNKFISVFELKEGGEVFRAGPFAHYVVGMAFTPDGKRIAATGCEKMLRFFDAATGEVMLTLPRKECSAIPKISDDGRMLGWSEPDAFCYIDLGKK